MSSLKASLRLEGKPINECCELLDHFFGAVLEEKRNRHEFLSEFPALLEDIFICGTDKKDPWIISQDRVHYEALVEMLKPDSNLFQLLYKFSQQDHVRVPFSRDRVPPAAKVPTNIQINGDKLMLNVLEYFMFIFCFAPTEQRHEDVSFAEDARVKAKESAQSSRGGAITKMNPFGTKSSSESKYKSSNCITELLQLYLKKMGTVSIGSGSRPGGATYHLVDGFLHSACIFWLGQNSQELVAQKIFKPPSRTVIGLVTTMFETLAKSIDFFRVQKALPSQGPNDTQLYHLHMSLSQDAYQFLKICFHFANRYQKMDYSGLVSLWTWIIRPWSGMSALTKQRDEDGGYSKRAKELFFKDEDDDTTSEIKVIEDCKTDEFNSQIIRAHVFRHVPFYTTLLKEFLLRAQNHVMRNEEDREDVKIVLACIMPTEANKVVEYLGEAARVMRLKLSTPGQPPNLKVSTEERTWIEQSFEVDREALYSLDDVTADAEVLVSVLKGILPQQSKSFTTKPKALIKMLCKTFQIDDAKLAATATTQGSSQGKPKDDSPIYDAEGFLTPLGQERARLGLLPRKIDQVRYIGDPLLKPIGENEVVILVRFFVWISRVIEKWTGRRYNLRFLADKFVWTRAAFLFVLVCILLLLVLGVVRK